MGPRRFCGRPVGVALPLDGQLLHSRRSGPREVRRSAPPVRLIAGSAGLSDLLLGLAVLFERDLDQPAQRICQAELLGRPGRYIEELRAADEHGEAAGPRDRDVEAVAGIEKVEIARCVCRAPWPPRISPWGAPCTHGRPLAPSHVR